MQQKRIPSIALPAALIAAAFIAGPALAQLPDSDRAILEDFFIAANGEDWHRNDGWLEPGSDPCEWYGVECDFRFDIDRHIVNALELPGNNLTGALDTRIFEIVHDRLDLSDNRLGGTLERLPTSPGRVDLSNNRFEGNLPSESSAMADDISGGPPSANWYLDLSRNKFEGEVPSGWQPPNWLSLANNRLEGTPFSLLDGSQLASNRFFDLSDNRFSGELPTSLMEGNFMPHNGPSRWGGGINLCWNDWSLPESAEFHEWFENHHVGGDYEQCLSGERQPVDPTISGSWYDPNRSGEGNAVQVLDNGMILNYFFTFDEEGRQQWLVGVEPPAENSVSWRELLRTKGQFGTGLLEQDEESIEVRGSFRIDRLGDDLILAERVFINQTGNACLAVYPPPLGCFGDSLSDRREYQRLTQLAGTTCETQSEFQEYSGAWYNPERSGEGFILEILPDDRSVVYWFTYTPDDSGEQVWMVGTGTIEHAVIVAAPPPGPHPVGIAELESVHQPLGGTFGEDFDPTAVELIDWGSLTLELLDDGSARVEWDSLLEGFDSGSYPLEQLARPMLAECD